MKNIWPNFPRIIEVFTQKIVTKPSKIWVWDPGSGKNLFRIPDPGVKKAPDPGSGSATLTYCACYDAVLLPGAGGLDGRISQWQLDTKQYKSSFLMQLE